MRVFSHEHPPPKLLIEFFKKTQKTETQKPSILKYVLHIGIASQQQEFWPKYHPLYSRKTKLLLRCKFQPIFIN